MKSLTRRASSSFKHNASFVARLPTIRRHKSQSLHSPGNQKPPAGSARGRVHRINDMNTSAENLGESFCFPFTKIYLLIYNWWRFWFLYSFKSILIFSGNFIVSFTKEQILSSGSQTLFVKFWNRNWFFLRIVQ